DGDLRLLPRRAVDDGAGGAQRQRGGAARERDRAADGDVAGIGRTADPYGRGEDPVELHVPHLERGRSAVRGRAEIDRPGSAHRLDRDALTRTRGADPGGGE